MKKKYIRHYRDKCIGCSACSDICPAYWKLSEEDGKTDLIDGIEKGPVFQRELNIEDEDLNRLAAESCPVNIIKID